MQTDSQISDLRLDEGLNGTMEAAPQFPKICTCCGKSHDAAAWKALEFVGTWGDSVETLELRNCQCHSTIAVVLGVV